MGNINIFLDKNTETNENLDTTKVGVNTIDIGIGEVNNQIWIWMVDIWVTDIIFVITLFSKIILLNGNTYQMLGNNTLPEIIKYDVQCLDQSNIQHFKMSNSSALKSIIGEGAVSVCLHGRNQINLDNEKICC